MPGATKNFQKLCRLVILNKLNPEPRYQTLIRINRFIGLKCSPQISDRDSDQIQRRPKEKRLNFMQQIQFEEILIENIDRYLKTEQIRFVVLNTEENEIS